MKFSYKGSDYKISLRYYRDIYPEGSSDVVRGKRNRVAKTVVAAFLLRYTSPKTVGVKSLVETVASDITTVKWNKFVRERDRAKAISKMLDHVKDADLREAALVGWTTRQRAVSSEATA